MRIVLEWVVAHRMVVHLVAPPAPVLILAMVFASIPMVVGPRVLVWVHAAMVTKIA